MPDAALLAEAASGTLTTSTALERKARRMLSDPSRQESDADACSIDRAASALAASGDLRDMIVALASSDAFRYARWLPAR
jgi:hypothetical protein